MIDLRLLHLAEKLAGVTGQRLQIPALALGVDRIQGERGFTAAAGAAAYSHLLARQLDGDVFQIVLLGALNGDVRDLAVRARLVPTLRVGTPAATLCVASSGVPGRRAS